LVFWWLGCIGDDLLLGVWLAGFVYDASQRIRCFFGLFWASEGVADRGFVWASKREAEKWHTETRSNLVDFCLARSQILDREGLV